MALEEDTVEKNEHGLPFKNEFDYDALYFWTSHFVHATVVAVLGHACQRGQVFKVRARGRVTQKQGENALVNAVVFLSKGFVCGCRAMNEEQPPVLMEMHKTLTTLGDKKERDGTKAK
jgi:hypothetical protein